MKKQKTKKQIPTGLANTLVRDITALEDMISALQGRVIDCATAASVQVLCAEFNKLNERLTKNEKLTAETFRLAAKAGEDEELVRIKVPYGYKIELKQI